MLDTGNVRLRAAVAADRRAIGALCALSMRRHGAAYYDADVIEAFLAIDTVAETLQCGGPFHVAEMGGVLVGMGGWSTGKAGFEKDRVLTASSGSEHGATVRSVFVHPNYARRGIARHLMARIEAEIASAGVASANLTSTLPAIPFYRSLGWRNGMPAVLSLPGGLRMVGLEMAKRLAVAGSLQSRDAA